MKSVGLLQSCSFDEISKVINDSLKLGSENNFGYDYMIDFEERFKPKHRNPVSTGWSDIDAIIGGGLGKSELGVVIAPTGAGKSMVLVHMGAAALRDGKNVVQYTLELQDTVIASRYDSCLTGYPLSDIKNFKQEIYEEIKDFDGSLIIPIWTASQTNRSGLSAEVITMEQISEAFNKCFVADFIFSVSRTIEDKQNNQGKIFIAKNRNGPDGMIYPIFMDTSSVNIKILPKPPVVAGQAQNQVVTAPVALAPKAQQQLLSAKYTKLRGKRKWEQLKTYADLDYPILL